MIRPSSELRGLLGEIVHVPTNESTVERKTQWLKKAALDLRTFRCYFLRELAACEELRGNYLHAVCYYLRAIRFAHRDPYDDLERCSHTLRFHGRRQDAMAVEALYGDRGCDSRLPQYFAEQRTRVAQPPAEDFVCRFDSRQKDRYRVCIVVSLYNAAAKLPLLLKYLTGQSTYARGEQEIILVDSNSPTDEPAIAEPFIAKHPHVCFVRTSRRETIQTAWNRGIALARADYLSFIGADEHIAPDCSEKLAAVLDANPNVDWVTANTKVTEVDAQGNHLRDIMPYDRTGANRYSQLQDTCTINFVGGMYRRNIHQRVGYYDDTFRVAGDTEFKLRALHAIEPAFLPEDLGSLCNYPEERMSFLPHAEIEDHRAWWLLRDGRVIAEHLNSPASRLFIPDLDAGLRLLRQALAFHRTFCRNTSADLQLATDVARILNRRFGPDPLLDPLLKTCERSLSELRLADRAGYDLYYQPNRLRELLDGAFQQAHDASQAVTAATGVEYSYHYDERGEKLLGVWPS